MINLSTFKGPPKAEGAAESNKYHIGLFLFASVWKGTCSSLLKKTPKKICGMFFSLVMCPLRVMDSQDTGGALEILRVKRLFLTHGIRMYGIFTYMNG